MVETTTASPAQAPRVVYFFPAWAPLYVTAAAATSIALHVLVTLPLGFSAQSDAVFGLLVLGSCAVVDAVARRMFECRILVSETFKYPVLYMWIPVCLWIMILRPFE